MALCKIILTIQKLKSKYNLSMGG